MQSLIAARFLKRFFGSRWKQRTINPASTAKAPLANDTDKPAEPAYTSTGNPPVTEPALENEQTGELNQLAGHRDASERAMTGDQPLTSDEPENG